MTFDSDLKRKISENLAQAYEETFSVNRLYDLSKEPASKAWDGKTKHEASDIVVNSGFNFLGVSISVRTLYRCERGSYSTTPTLVKLIINE